MRFENLDKNCLCVEASFIPFHSVRPQRVSSIAGMATTSYVQSVFVEAY